MLHQPFRNFPSYFRHFFLNSHLKAKLFVRAHRWTACLLFEDVSEEMKKHADHLTPSHFGEANDSKINRKQRHRKQCETRDTRGIYHSNRANNTDIQPCGLFTLVFICKGLRVILYISSFLKCRKKIIPERSAPALILSVEKL